MNSIIIMGKNKNISKAARIKLKEEIRIRNEQLKLSLQHHNQVSKSFASIIDEIISGKYIPKINSGHFEIYCAFQKLSVKSKAGAKAHYQSILLQLHSQKCKNLLAEPAYLKAIMRIAEKHASFIRDIKSWKRTKHNIEKQFSSILRHLFCKYDTPVFLDKAWLSESKHDFSAWFIYVGQGISLSSPFQDPIVMTKKTAHFFLKANDEFTVEQALRWAQVVGMGGDYHTAESIAFSWLSRNNFEHEEFWAGVIRFFARAAAMLEREKLNQIIDYIRNEKMANLGFSMKGRTIEALIRQSDQWHQAVWRAKNRGGRLVWESSGINEFLIAEGNEENQINYLITELLSSKELIEEGKKMRHCVATYANLCNSKKCTIFSLRKESKLNKEICATIEIDLRSRTIVQAKAKCNAQIAPKTKKLMQQWANAEDLRLAKYL